MVPWAQDTWGPLVLPEQEWGMAALQLTLLLLAARRQDQVIDGHGPCAASHPLDQHLQGCQHGLWHNMVEPGNGAGTGGHRGATGQTELSSCDLPLGRGSGGAG